MRPVDHLQDQASLPARQSNFAGLAGFAKGVAVALLAFGSFVEIIKRHVLSGHWSVAVQHAGSEGADDPWRCNCPGVFMGDAHPRSGFRDRSHALVTGIF